MVPLVAMTRFFYLKPPVADQLGPYCPYIPMKRLRYGTASLPNSRSTKAGGNADYGLNNPGGSPTTISKSGSWPEGFSLTDVIDNESYVSAFAQRSGTSNPLVAKYDRCTVEIASEPVL